MSLFFPSWQFLNCFSSAWAHGQLSIIYSTNYMEILLPLGFCFAKIFFSMVSWLKYNMILHPYFFIFVFYGMHLQSLIMYVILLAGNHLARWWSDKWACSRTCYWAGQNKRTKRDIGPRSCRFTFSGSTLKVLLKLYV